MKIPTGPELLEIMTEWKDNSIHTKKSVKLLGFLTAIFCVYKYLSYSSMVYTSTTTNTSEVMEYINFINVQELHPIEALQDTVELVLSDLKQYGLNLKQIKYALSCITIIRFMILVLRYNLVTSFTITIISLICGFMWYVELYSVLKPFLFYVKSMNAFIYPQVLADAMSQASKSEMKFIHTPNPFGFLSKYVRLGMSKDKHNIDAISMGVSGLRKTVPLLSDLYYLFYTHLIPKGWTIFYNIINQYKSLIVFGLIIRRGKEYCPYLIRWHATYLFLLKMFTIQFVTILRSIHFYMISTLTPEFNRITTAQLGMGIRTIYNSGTKEILFQLQLAAAFQYVILLVTVAIYVYGSLYAICGQYFYVPILTDATELHVGERNTSSLYSGGLTSWQDMEVASDNKRWYNIFDKSNKKSILFVIYNFFRILIIRIFKRS